MSAIITSSRHELYDFVSYKHGLREAAKGKRVLITGAGTGIGRYMAKHFAAAGASSIIITGRRTAPLDEVKADINEISPHCDVSCISTDITDEASVTRLFENAAKGGNVDVLINNAGSLGVLAKVGEEKSLSDFWIAYEVNIKGSYLATSKFLRLLGDKPGIVINTSTIGSYTTFPGFAAYGTSKTALNRLTEFTAAEHGNVICIAFHPGVVADTDMAQNMPDWMKAHLTDDIELAAATALYLTTPAAAFLSGRYVEATWDMEELEGLREKITSEDLLKTRVNGIGN